MEPWALPLRYAPLHPYPGLSSPGHIFSLSYKCFITGLGPLSCLAPTLSPRSSWKLLPNRTITPPPSMSPWPQPSASLPTWPLWALAGSCHSSLCLPASHPHPLPPGTQAGWWTWWCLQILPAPLDCRVTLGKLLDLPGSSAVTVTHRMPVRSHM